MTMRSNPDYATENLNLIKQINELKKENQELAETLELYNEKFAGHERVKADLLKENKELKFQLECKSKGNEIIIKQMNLFMKQRDKYIEENEKLKKAIEILKEETELRIAVVQGQYLIQQGAGNLKGIYVSKEKGELLNEVLGNERISRSVEYGY